MGAGHGVVSSLSYLLVLMFRLINPNVRFVLPVTCMQSMREFQDSPRALTKILKTGVQDSHLAKSRSPTPKSLSPTNLCIPYIFPIFAGSDTLMI